MADSYQKIKGKFFKLAARYEWLENRRELEEYLRQNEGNPFITVSLLPVKEKKGKDFTRLFRTPFSYTFSHARRTSTGQQGIDIEGGRSLSSNDDDSSLEEKMANVESEIALKLSIDVDSEGEDVSDPQGSSYASPVFQMDGSRSAGGTMHSPFSLSPRSSRRNSCISTRIVTLRTDVSPLLSPSPSSSSEAGTPDAISFRRRTRRKSPHVASKVHAVSFIEKKHVICRRPMSPSGRRGKTSGPVIRVSPSVITTGARKPRRTPRISSKRIVEEVDSEDESLPKSSPDSVVEVVVDDEDGETPFWLLPDILVKRFSTIRESLAKRIFNHINEVCLDNKLPNDVSVEWNQLMTKSSGMAKIHKGIDDRGSSIIVNVAIHLSTKVVTDPERLGNVLAHEMCHVCQWTLSKVDKPPHGPLFWYWAKRIMDKIPSIKITQKHNYEIQYKYLYKCSRSDCDFVLKRHSILRDSRRCPRCNAQLII